MDACEICAVFLGPSGIGPWHNEEMRVALDRRVRDRNADSGSFLSFCLEQILLTPTNCVHLKLQRGWVDFRKGLDDPSAFHRLLSGIKGTPRWAL